jgi:hypothetical protein
MIVQLMLILELRLINIIHIYALMLMHRCIDQNIYLSEVEYYDINVRKLYKDKKSV